MTASASALVSRLQDLEGSGRQEYLKELAPDRTTLAAATVLAARIGAQPALGALLAHGADPNCAGRGGELPLHAAANAGHAESVRLLLSAGAEADGKDRRYSETALMHAAAAGHENVVEVLLAAGASPSVTSPEGANPLCSAAAGGHLEAALRLLEAGADPNPDQGPGSPIIAAALSGNVDLLRRLIQFGAKVTPNVLELVGQRLKGRKVPDRKQINRILQEALQHPRSEG